MHRFRGDPTYFGFPSCDDEGVCSPVAVVKYSPEEDKWEEMQGELETPRRGHLVLKIKIECCILFFHFLRET